MLESFPGAIAKRTGTSGAITFVGDAAGWNRSGTTTNIARISTGTEDTPSVAASFANRDAFHLETSTVTSAPSGNDVALGIGASTSVGTDFPPGALLIAGVVSKSLVHSTTTQRSSSVHHKPAAQEEE